MKDPLYIWFIICISGSLIFYGIVFRYLFSGLTGYTLLILGCLLHARCYSKYLKGEQV